MNEIKQDIINTFESVDFLEGQDDKLVGYAEMFGEDCIPLYEYVNYFPYNSPEDAILCISDVNENARKSDGFDNSAIGHLKLSSGKTILLYSRDGIISQLKNEYMQDTSGIFADEEDCETSALEYYNYNIIGSYLDGIPTFAVLYSE